MSSIAHPLQILVQISRHFTACCLLISMMLAINSQASDDLFVAHSYDKELIRTLMDGFAKDQKVNVYTDYFNVDALKSGLLSLMELSPPDIIILPSDQVGLYAFANYSEINPKNFKAKFPERILSCGISDGKLYGVPLIQGNHLFLFYNKALVDTPAPDWQTLSAQKSYFDAKKVGLIGWPVNEPYYFMPFLGAYGGWPLVGGNIQLNNDATINALKFYRSTRQALHSVTCDLTCTENLFKRGALAYTIGGTWEINNYANALGQHLGVTNIPMALDKKVISPFTTYVIAFPNQGLTGEKRAILIKLVDYLQSPVVQRKLWDQFQVIPVEASAYEYAKDNANGYMKEILRLMEETKPVTADQSMSAIWSAMSKGLTRYNEGLLTAEAAADFMQQNAERNARAIQKSPQNEKVKINKKP